nr:hypothetical protein [Sphingomonas sp.]
MARLATRILTVSGIAAALALTAAGRLSVFAQAQPGLWEISGAPGTHTPIRQCVADVTSLARFEHRSRGCTARILKDGGTSAQIEYSCAGAGFGHSEIELITPRSLRIATQGISDGLPFNYVLQARRVDDCPKSASVTRH